MLRFAIPRLRPSPNSASADPAPRQIRSGRRPGGSPAAFELFTRASGDSGTRTTAQAGVSSGASLVHQALASPARPLDGATRSFMEPGFGHDFSQVRVHANPEAAESADAVSALAYTVGQHIVFGDGQYAPDTDRGRRILAHELTHVVQQGAGLVEGAPARQEIKVGEPYDLYERQADSVATKVMKYGPAKGPHPLMMARDGSSGAARPRLRPPAAGSVLRLPAGPAKPTTGSFTEAETLDSCVKAALAIPEGVKRTFAVEGCIIQLDKLTMKQVIGVLQALRSNFRPSFAVLAANLDVTFAPRVDIAHKAVTDPDALAARTAPEIAKQSFLGEDEAGEALFFARTMSGRVASGRPNWADPATGLPRAVPGAPAAASALSQDQQRMLDYIRENRASIVRHPQLIRSGPGLVYFGHPSTDPMPTDVSATGTGSLERDLWDELKGEGGSSSINTWDRAKLTWGRGFAATGQLNVLFDKLYTRAPALMDEMYQAGFALPKGGSNDDYLAVDARTGLVRAGQTALDLIRQDKEIHSLLIGLAEADDYKQPMADAQWELLVQRETFRPIRDAVLRGQIATWPRTSVRFAAHSIHLAGMFTWGQFLPTAGNLAQIASILFRGLGGNFVSQPNGARLGSGAASHAPATWANGELGTLLGAPRPLPADCQTSPAFYGSVFLPAEPGREPLAPNGTMNTGMSIRVFTLVP